MSAKPKKTEVGTLMQQGDRLNLWNDEYYEQSNPLIRSAIFAITNRRTIFTKFERLEVVGEGTIEYKGEQLNVFDEDVYLQLLHYCRGQSLTKSIDTNRSQLIRDLNLSPGGKNYARLMKSLDRLASGTLKISTPHILRRMAMLLTKPSLARNINEDFIRAIQDRYYNYINAINEALAHQTEFSLTVRFIQNQGINPSNGRLVLSLDPLMVLLYDGINTTRTKIEERRKLVPAEVKLLGYIMSHEGQVYPLKIETIHSLLGSTINLNTNKPRFISNLNHWLTRLEAIDRIRPGWKIEKGKVQGLRRISYSADDQLF